MKHVVVLTGAGISAESGLKTFRGAGGLWEGHDVTQVATPEAFRRDPALVLRFYNERRRQALQAQPNPGHQALVKLEEAFEVTVITQNIDDLHERAGSRRIIHLHGELRKKRSATDPYLLDDWTEDLQLGDLAPDGGQWRPHIVWFGEDVPMMIPAMEATARADAFLIVGTSLQVYPAASLVQYVPEHASLFLVDPNIPFGLESHPRITCLAEPASTGVQKVVDQLIG